MRRKRLALLQVRGVLHELHGSDDSPQASILSELRREVGVGMSMTETERLREMLDEHGVKWEDDTPVPSMKPWKTSFTSFTGEEVSIGCYDEPKWIMGTLVFHTPEQAIAATLGTGTCHNDTFDDYRIFRCSACHTVVAICICDEPDATDTISAHEFRFCPHCGARVVQE